MVSEISGEQLGKSLCWSGNWWHYFNQKQKRLQRYYTGYEEKPGYIKECDRISSNGIVPYESLWYLFWCVDLDLATSHEASDTETVKRLSTAMFIKMLVG